MQKVRTLKIIKFFASQTNLESGDRHLKGKKKKKKDNVTFHNLLCNRILGTLMLKKIFISKNH